jgi:hypothetical protein
MRAPALLDPTPVGRALAAWIERTQVEFAANETLRIESTHEIVRWIITTFAQTPDNSQ